MPKSKKTAEPPAESAPATTPKSTKIDALLELLRREGGASVPEMMEATGWQAHSVRGAMSGAIKKGLGLAIVSEKIDDQRRYRIEAEAEA